MEEKKQVIESPRNKYNCLMLKFDIENWDSFVHKLIEPKDIFLTEKEGYGIERNAHVTLLFGIHDYVSLEKVKKCLVPIKFIKCKSNTIDIFSNPQFDVVKFNVEGNYLKQMNTKLRETVDYTCSHPDYKPHMTIGYVNPGTGKKYKKTMANMLLITPVAYIYSHADGTKEQFVM
jgi:hypothetical protein